MSGASRSVCALLLAMTVLMFDVACERGGDGKRSGPLERQRGGDPPRGPASLEVDPPLIIAARTGDAAAVRQMLVNGADVNTFGDGRQTALMVAAQAGHRNVVKVLLDAGADVNLRDAKGNTAAEHAAARGKEGMAEMLRKSEVKPPAGPAKPVDSPPAQPTTAPVE